MMIRPPDDLALIEVAEKEFTSLFSLIDSIPEEKRMKNFHFEDRDKNIRDALMHLYRWHLMMLTGMT